MTRPGIVNVCKFVNAGGRKFSSYIKYIDRHEAIRNEHFKEFNVNNFDGYQHYMENPEKSSGLFTMDKDTLNARERARLKESFILAQKNDSVMWQDVVSFDNDFLEKEGIYDSKKGYLNEKRIQDAVRESMKETLKNENMEASAIWTASIHFNTDNIHVHIATVEPYPTRHYKEFVNKKTGEHYTARRGSRKKGTLDLMKSKVIHRLFNRDKELEKISELVKYRMLPTDVKMKKFLTLPMQLLMQDIYKNMPDDLRKWKYNMAALDSVRPKIDVLVNMYVNQYHPEDRSELNEALNDQKNFYKRVYGDGTKEFKRYEEYKTNKEKEFYSKLGNAFLKELKTVRQDDQHRFHKQWEGSRIYSPSIIKRSTLKKIRNGMHVEYRHIKNRNKYKELQEEIERKS